jgi:hypothetical protein
VHTCLETIQNMVATQAQLQSQVTKLQQSLEQSAPSAPMRSSPATRSPARQQKSPEELEIESISRLMTDGNYEQATMQWLQSRRTAELFDEVFIRCNPSYIRQVSPLLALSAGAVVSGNLDRNTVERLVWLDAVLTSVNPNVSVHRLLKLYNANNAYRTPTFVTSFLRLWKSSNSASQTPTWHSMRALPVVNFFAASLRR